MACRLQFVGGVLFQTNKKTMKITLLKENVEIKFDLATEISYEEIAGTPFDVNDLRFYKNLSALCMASIIAHNPKTKITYERLLKEADGQEFAQLGTVVVQEMTKWMKLPEVMVEGEKPAEKKKN